MRIDAIALTNLTCNEKLSYHNDIIIFYIYRYVNHTNYTKIQTQYNVAI